MINLIHEHMYQIFNCFHLVKKNKTTNYTNKHKQSNVRRIAHERQAGGKTFDPTGIRTIDLPINNQMH